MNTYDKEKKAPLIHHKLVFITHKDYIKNNQNNGVNLSDTKTALILKCIYSTRLIYDVLVNNDRIYNLHELSL